MVLAAASVASTAYQPLITDDTGTQGKGGNQFELGFNRDREQQAGTANNSNVVPLTYTRGLTDTLDAFISINHTRLSSNLPGSEASGGGNPSAGFKWRFWENESNRTSLAVKPELRLPVSPAAEAAGRGNGRSSYGLTLILTQETGFGAVHANLAAGHDHYRSLAIGPDSEGLRASITPVWHIGDQWKLAVDTGRDKQRVGGRDSFSGYFEIGAVYSPNKDLDFAVGVLRRSDRGTPGATAKALTAGITWRFE